ncbi:hypothetical protein EDD22DRAFT_960092 [Suillus occidentalis]|nr:hypothetical protein EDD22DRAFT_960092 [Suillus occidentalis]
MAEHREAADTRCRVGEAILMGHTSAQYVSIIGCHFNVRMQPFTDTFKAPQGETGGDAGACDESISSGAQRFTHLT